MTFQQTVGQADHQWDTCVYCFQTTCVNAVATPRYPVAFWEMCESLPGPVMAPTCLIYCGECRRCSVDRQRNVSLCLSFLSLMQYFSTLDLTYGLITLSQEKNFDSNKLQISCWRTVVMGQEWNTFARWRGGPLELVPWKPQSLTGCNQQPKHEVFWVVTRLGISATFSVS